MHGFAPLQGFPFENQCVKFINELEWNGYNIRQCCDQSGGSHFVHIICHSYFDRLEEFFGFEYCEGLLRGMCLNFVNDSENRHDFMSVWRAGKDNTAFRNLKELRQFLKQGHGVGDFSDPLPIVLLAMCLNLHVVIFFGDGYMWSTVSEEVVDSNPNSLLAFAYVGEGLFMVAERHPEALPANMFDFVVSVTPFPDVPDFVEPPYVPPQTSAEFSSMVDNVLAQVMQAEPDESVAMEDCEVEEMPQTRECYVRLEKLSHVSEKRSMKLPDISSPEIADLSKVFMCEICDDTFGKNSEVRKHIRSVHGMVTCSVPKCIRAFQDEKTMRLHALTHLPSDMSCGVCGKVCKSLGLLQKHSVRHSDEKPYPCNICDKSFKRANELKEHKVKIHMYLEFACSKCEKVFPSERLLGFHFRNRCA